MSSQSVVEQVSAENQDSAPTTIAEAPRSSSGREAASIAINEIEEDKSKDETVVIVASSSSDNDGESTTLKNEIVQELEKEEEPEAVTEPALRPTPSSKKRKFGRFSKNRNKIRKRLRQKIKGKTTIDALTLVRAREELEKKKSTKNSFLLKGNIDTMLMIYKSIF